jgi:hypothetical protein
MGSERNDARSGSTAASRGKQSAGNS